MMEILSVKCLQVDDVILIVLPACTVVLVQGFCWCGAIRGVASGTASRALALIDFRLAGPIEPTFSARFPCTATRLLERSLSSGGFRGVSLVSIREHAYAYRSDPRPSAVIFADVAN